MSEELGSVSCCLGNGRYWKEIFLLKLINLLASQRERRRWLLFRSLSSSLPIVCVLHFFRREHEFTWGLLHGWCAAERLSRSEQTIESLRHQLHTLPSNKTQILLLFHCLFALLLVIPKNLSEVKARAEKNFRFLIFIRSKWKRCFVKVKTTWK